MYLATCYRLLRFNIIFLMYRMQSSQMSHKLDFMPHVLGRRNLENTLFVSNQMTSSDAYKQLRQKHRGHLDSGSAHCNTSVRLA